MLHRGRGARVGRAPLRGAGVVPPEAVAPHAGAHAEWFRDVVHFPSIVRARGVSQDVFCVVVSYLVLRCLFVLFVLYFMLYVKLHGVLCVVGFCVRVASTE